jgi:hypothetical protein
VALRESRDHGDDGGSGLLHDGDLQGEERKRAGSLPHLLRAAAVFNCAGRARAGPPARNRVPGSSSQKLARRPLAALPGLPVAVEATRGRAHRESGTCARAASGYRRLSKIQHLASALMSFGPCVLRLGTRCAPADQAPSPPGRLSRQRVQSDNRTQRDSEAAC